MIKTTRMNINCYHEIKNDEWNEEIHCNTFFRLKNMQHIWKQFSENKTLQLGSTFA